MTNIFKRMLSGRQDVRVRDDDRKALTLAPEDMSLTVVGYSADELRDILAVYREHTTLMLNAMQTLQQSADAVRYRPGPPPIVPEDDES